jgi:hypothetical protein
MAMEQDNEASMRLFTTEYSKFYTSSGLVNLVFCHASAPSRSATIVQLDPRDAELLYRWHFASVEFFPSDIHTLSLSTFLVVPNRWEWAGVEAFVVTPPVSCAVLSVWNCKDTFRLEVRGAPRDGCHAPGRQHHVVALNPIHPEPVCGDTKGAHAQGHLGGEGCPAYHRGVRLHQCPPGARHYSSTLKWKLFLP